MSDDDRAQSETVGVILLTAVIVISVGLVGVVILDRPGVGSTGDIPLIDADIRFTPSTVEITHAGGNSVDVETLAVVIRGGSSPNRYDVEAGEIVGNGDDRFEPSEKWSRSHEFSAMTDVSLYLVHEPSNTVVDREYASVPREAESQSPVASFTVEPADAVPSEAVSFDATGSSDDDGIVAYRWNWNDGSETETTTDPRVDHAFGTPGNYEVTLTVVDGAGGEDSKTETVTVSTEVELDDVALDDDDGDSLVAPGDEVTVSATLAESGPGVDSVTADASAFDAGTVTLSDGGDDGTYEGSFVVGDSPTEGDQSVAVTATDVGGNTDSATTGPLTVDATAPSIETFDVTDQSYLSGSLLGLYVETYRIQWVATDNETGGNETSVSVSREGESQATYPTNSGDQEYRNGRGLFVYEGRDHTITIIATDAAGNRACRTVTDTADGTDPPASAYESC